MFGDIWMKFLIKRIKGMVARIFRRRMKKQISAALRQQVWIKHKNKIFESDCSISWCKNIINVFNFQCGHNIPESKGGATNINNLYLTLYFTKSKNNLLLKNAIKIPISIWTSINILNFSFFETIKSK